MTTKTIVDPALFGRTRYPFLYAAQMTLTAIIEAGEPVLEVTFGPKLAHITRTPLPLVAQNGDDVTYHLLIEQDGHPVHLILGIDNGQLFQSGYVPGAEGLAHRMALQLDEPIDFTKVVVLDIQSTQVETPVSLAA